MQSTRRNQARANIALATVFAVLVQLLALAAPAAAAVTGVSVSADTLVAGKSANYTVDFTVESGLGPLEDIRVGFPSGYDLTGVSAASVSIVHAGTTYTTSSVVVSGTLATITTSSDFNVPAGASLKVNIGGVKNPTTAGSYTISVRTQRDSAGSAQVTIVADEPAELSLAAPTDVVKNQVAPVTVKLQDQYGNAATASSDVAVTLTLTEPTATANGSAGLYKDSAASTPLAGNQLTIPTGSQEATAYLKDSEAETLTLDASAVGLTPPPSASINVKPFGNASKLVLTGGTTITAGTPGNYTLEVRDEFGNAVQVSSDLAVTVTAVGATGTVSWTGLTPDANDSTKATGTIPSGSSSLTFTFADTKAESVSLTASAANLTDAQLNVTVNPAAADHLVVMVEDKLPSTADVEINSGERARVTIRVEDQFGNPVPDPTARTVSLTTNSLTGNGKFYLDATSTTAVTQATIQADASEVTVYYYDQLRPTDPVILDIAVSAGLGGTVADSASVKLTGIRPDKLDISGASSVEVNLRTPLTLKLLDQYGNDFAPASNTTINLTSTPGSAEFYMGATGGSPVNSVEVPAGQSSVTIYYRPTSVGSHQIEANTTVQVGATPIPVNGTFTLTATPAGTVMNGLTISAVPIKAGERAPVTIEVTDQYGNPVTQTADVAVSLATNSKTGKFYDQPSGGNEITNVTISSGNSSATVWYYDETAGMWDLTASAAGLDEGQGTVVVTPANATAIRLEAPTTVTVGQKATVVATIVDGFGNPVPQGADLTITLSSSSITGVFRNSAGSRITQVTVPSGSHSVDFTYEDDQPANVTLTARTTGLADGIVTLSVVETDATAPADVSDLTAAAAPGVGTFKLAFTMPADADAAEWQVSIAGEATPIASGPGNSGESIETTINLPGAVTLGKPVTLVVQAVDAAGNASAGVQIEVTPVAVKGLTPGPDNWITFSVPVYLASGQKLLGDVLPLDQVEIAYKYDAQAQSWVQVTDENNAIEPLEAVYVKLKSGTTAVVNPTTTPLAPPVRLLAPGWNLIGSAWRDGTGIGDALSSVDDWRMAVSPAVNNPDSWSATPRTWPEPEVHTYAGYWLYVEQADQLVGSTNTPANLGQYRTDLQP